MSVAIGITNTFMREYYHRYQRHIVGGIAIIYRYTFGEYCQHNYIVYASENFILPVKKSKKLQKKLTEYK